MRVNFKMLCLRFPSSTVRGHLCRLLVLVACLLFSIESFALYPTFQQTHPQKAMHQTVLGQDAAWEAIQKGTFLQQGDASSNQAPSTQSNTQPLKRHYALMVLVSSSMPKPLLIRYLKKVSRLGGRMVIRGWVGGDIEHTATFVKAMARATGQTVTIDPVVFEKLGVTRVPVIALFDAAGLRCLQQDDCTLESSDFLMVRGNISLHQALSEFVSKGGADTADSESDSAEAIDAGLLKTAKRLLQASDVIGAGA